MALSSRDVVNPSLTAPEELTADAVLRFRLLVTDLRRSAKVGG